MTKLLTVFIACSLTLAAGAWAAKPDANKDAGKKPKNAPKQQAAPKQQQVKAPKTEVRSERARKTNDAGPKVSKKQVPQTPDVSNARRPDKPNKIEKDQLKTSKKEEKLQTAKQPKLRTGDQQLRKTKLSKESVGKIKAQHRDFKAKPNTSIAAVQFNQNYQIANAQSWTGPRYEVFRTYRPQWHDQSSWRSRYTTISLIGGGWYYWDAGYWYPAWGYDEAAAYYPYDGPIYVGSDPRPFDQVVADVQAALQEMGYYRGEVDGLLGPLTRQALADYQSAAGLYTTQTIDQPTLESLGLA